MLNAIQYALMSIISLFGIVKYCIIDMNRNRLMKKLKHFEQTDGTVINCWKTEPKGDIPMYKFACAYTDKDGERKVVCVRDNFTGKQYYGYRTEENKKIGSKEKVIYNKSNSGEAYVLADLEAEKDSFKLDYILTVSTTIIGILLVGIIRAIILNKFGV